jgi:hypothetical protein
MEKEKDESRANAKERHGQRSQEKTERCREKYMRAMDATKETEAGEEARQDADDENMETD